MADKPKIQNSKLDALYQWLSLDLQKTKEELMNELKISSAQIGYLYQGIKNDKDNSSVALEREIRFGYKQNQNIYEGLDKLVKTEVAARIDAMDEKMAQLKRIDDVMAAIEQLDYNYKHLMANNEALSDKISNEFVPKLETIVDKDGVKAIVEECATANTQKVLDGVATLPAREEVKTIVEEATNVHNQQVLDAIAAIPAAEAVDYVRIREELGDKLLELLNDLKTNQAVATEEDATEGTANVAIDYEKIAGDTSAKVMESLPFPEPVDYNRIDESVLNAVSEAVSVDAIVEAVAAKVSADAIAQKVTEAINADAIAQTVVSAISAEAIAQAVAASLDVDAIAQAVAEKVTVPAAPEVDYDLLAEMVVDKLAAKGISADVILDEEGIDKIADTVAEKVGTVDNIDYEKVTLAAQAAQVVPEAFDYDRVAAIVEEKFVQSFDGMEKIITLDDEGVEKIVNGVTDELRNMTLVCEYASEEEEEVPAVVEEEPVVEEVVEEEPIVEEELAAAEAPVAPVVERVAEVMADVPHEYEEDGNGQLIDAETGLVVRLKRSFTAKMKQSDEQVKVYYSDIKNALTSYKKINSNVSWHGDRFNYGRETVAKIGINGKTLCFYLALDPNDPELKSTVYHQKDVGAQKAYESTPFMVKVKSDAASKKALRLVGILANKLGAVEDESFVEVDYVAEYAYETTKQLFEEGDIKATKEKKVDFNF